MRAHQVQPQHRQRTYEVPTSLCVLVLVIQGKQSRPKSVPRQCLACWVMWMPTSPLLTWDEFTHKLRSDNEFKERVDR